MRVSTVCRFRHVVDVSRARMQGTEQGGEGASRQLPSNIKLLLGAGGFYFRRARAQGIDEDDKDCVIRRPRDQLMAVTPDQPGTHRILCDPA